MSYLVDTYVFCEPVRPKPDAGALAWLRDESELYFVTRNVRDFKKTGIAVLNPFRKSA